MKQAIAVLGLVLLAGCVTEKDRFKLYATGEVCDVDALAKERTTAITTINGWRRSIAPHQNGTTAAGAGRSDQYNATMRLLNRYEAEIEVGHQAIDQSCRLLSRCMEVNRYDERLCAGAATQYGEAQERFATLLAYERNVREEVRKVYTKPGTAAAGTPGPTASAGEPEGTDKPESCEGWDWLSTC